MVQYDNWRFNMKAQNDDQGYYILAYPNVDTQDETGSFKIREKYMKDFKQMFDDGNVNADDGGKYVIFNNVKIYLGDLRSMYRFIQFKKSGDGIISTADAYNSKL